VDLVDIQKRKYMHGTLNEKNEDSEGSEGGAEEKRFDSERLPLCGRTERALGFVSRAREGALIGQGSYFYLAQNASGESVTTSKKRKYDTVAPRSAVGDTPGAPSLEKNGGLFYSNELPLKEAGRSYVVPFPVSGRRFSLAVSSSIYTEPWPGAGSYPDYSLTQLFSSEGPSISTETTPAQEEASTF